MKPVLEDKKIQAVYNKMYAELLEKLNRRDRYFTTKKFQKDFSKVKRFLVKNKDHFISAESIAYFPKKYPFTERFFIEIIESIYPHVKKHQDEENPFHHDCFEYKGVSFMIMNGQGTSYTAWIE